MSCYYVSSEKYLLSQLERNGAFVDELNISDFENVCQSLTKIADTLEECGRLSRSCSTAINDMIAKNTKPFVCCHMCGVEYDFLSWNAVVQAVSEYRVFGRVYPFITMIADQFTVERVSHRAGTESRKRYFGKMLFRPNEFDVLGKIIWDGNTAYIQPLIIV